MANSQTKRSFLRFTLIAGALATSLTTGTAFANHGGPHGPGNLPDAAEEAQANRNNPGNTDNQGNPASQNDSENQENHGEASLAHRKGFSGLVSNVKANGNDKSFDLTLELGGEEHKIMVVVNADTVFRGKDHDEIEDANKPVDAFFTMLMDLVDNSGTEVRANVRGELTEENDKMKIVAEQVSLHEIPDAETE